MNVLFCARLWLDHGYSMPKNGRLFGGYKNAQMHRLVQLKRSG
jgi:hypothetical protein